MAEFQQWLTAATHCLRTPGARPHTVIWIAPGLSEGLIQQEDGVMPAQKKYPQEVRDRAVRMVNEKLTAEPALAVSTVCRLVGDQIGINKNTLRNWVKQNHIDSGGAAGTTTDEKQKITDLEKEVRELRKANEILRKASAFFAQAELDRR